jgi:hypothetical protein
MAACIRFQGVADREPLDEIGERHELQSRGSNARFIRCASSVGDGRFRRVPVIGSWASYRLAIPRSVRSGFGRGGWRRADPLLVNS